MEILITSKDIIHMMLLVKHWHLRVLHIPHSTMSLHSDCNSQTAILYVRSFVSLDHLQIYAIIFPLWALTQTIIRVIRPTHYVIFMSIGLKVMISYAFLLFQSIIATLLHVAMYPVLVLCMIFATLLYISLLLNTREN